MVVTTTTSSKKEERWIMNPKRSCKGCTACCVVFTVVDMDKPSHTPCQHICERGCAIHDEPRPSMCTDFLCNWVTHPDWGEELRPDKCGIVYAAQGHLLPNRPHKLVMGTMKSPYAHLRKENRKHIERLCRAGHVVFLLYEDDGGPGEYHYYFDQRRYPSLTPTDILKGLKRNNGDLLKKNNEFYQRRGLAGAATGRGEV